MSRRPGPCSKPMVPSFFVMPGSAACQLSPMERCTMIALLAFILWLISAPAYAQFGGTIVSDPLTEQNTGTTVTALGTANAMLAQIQTSDAATALSMTTPCDPGLYTG